jgi:hypothetical protein
MKATDSLSTEEAVLKPWLGAESLREVRWSVVSRTTKSRSLVLCLIILVSLPFDAWPGSIDEVTFLSKVELYETIVDTSLVTSEGKRLPITKGTRLNVAGFTMTEAFVISRMDKPNGFVRKTDISPIRGGSEIREESIKEKILR